jgi:hypothetical protein
VTVPETSATGPLIGTLEMMSALGDIEAALAILQQRVSVIAAWSDERSGMTATEHDIGEILLGAQRAAAELTAAIETQREAILSTAREMAESIISEAEARARRISTEAEVRDVAEEQVHNAPASAMSHTPARQAQSPAAPPSETRQDRASALRTALLEFSKTNSSLAEGAAAMSRHASGS